MVPDADSPPTPTPAPLPFVQPYKTIGMYRIDRFPTRGYNTGRVSICVGCRQLGGTLNVLVKNDGVTIYTHAKCRAKAWENLATMVKGGDDAA